MAFLPVKFAYIVYNIHCLPSNKRGKSKECDSEYFEPRYTGVSRKQNDGSEVSNLTEKHAGDIEPIKSRDLQITRFTDHVITRHFCF